MVCGREHYPREQAGAFSVRADPSKAVWTHERIGAGAPSQVPFPGCDTVYATFKYAVEVRLPVACCHCTSLGLLDWGCQLPTPLRPLLHPA